MKVFHGIPSAEKAPRRLVLTIGVFDGIHRGHLAVLRKTLSRARALGARAGVLTFEGHPDEVVSPQFSPPLLLTGAQKTELLRQAGMDVVFLPRFSKAFARIRAMDFIGRWLHGRLHVKEVVVGSDFVFGRQGRGDIALLKRMGKPLGFKVRVVRPLKVGGGPVSSTRIRSAVLSGDMALAKRLLGRPFILEGRVVRGRGLGTRLGFPTANLVTGQEVLPRPGIWGGRLGIKGAPRRWWFVADLGTRPSVKEKGRMSLEFHLAGFKGSLYGRILQAEFLRYLREEKKFSSLEALKKAIAGDKKRFLETAARGARA